MKLCVSVFFSFTGSVKLKGIIISGEDDDSHPAEIRLWVAVPADWGGGYALAHSGSHQYIQYTASCTPSLTLYWFNLGTRTFPRCPLTTLAENPNKRSDSTETLLLNWSTQQSKSTSSFFFITSTSHQHLASCYLSSNQHDLSRGFSLMHSNKRPQAQIKQMVQWWDMADWPGFTLRSFMRHLFVKNWGR